MTADVLDLFAGHGWAVACRALGVRERGVEIDDDAVATRELNGFETVFRDVWEGLRKPSLVPEFTGLIASPPCQTFSAAGGGAGRQAIEYVLTLVSSGMYRDVAMLDQFVEKLGGDDRTALVLTPLAYAAEYLPKWVVMEQVPPVLPVWEISAVELRRLGYSVWTGLLDAERYGVPQTRKRAILIARRDGATATPPAPTHSRYYPSNPARLDGGVLPWVSMAEALGWSDEELLQTNQRPDHSSDDYQTRPTSAPAPTVTGIGGRSWNRVMRSNYMTGAGDRAGLPGERSAAHPAPTITSHADRNMWVFERPATTIAGDSRVWPPGHKVNADDRRRMADADEVYGDRAGTNAIRVTPDEAARLQSYPTGFRFAGLKGSVHEQIGNAVPPLLAEAILRPLVFELAEPEFELLAP